MAVLWNPNTVEIRRYRGCSKWCLLLTLLNCNGVYCRFNFPLKISVKDMKGRRFEFPVRDWIDTKGLVAQRNLALSSNGFQDQPPKPSLKSRKLGILLLRLYFTAFSFFSVVETLI